MMTRSHCYCFITIFVSLLLHTLASPTLNFCRQDQRDALLEFMHEFPTAKSFPSSWNKRSDCCFWEGVKCDDKSGQVISLDLSDKSLNGSMKTNSSLFKLHYLRDLFLTNCHLQGEIPSSLGNLNQLRLLNLDWNHGLTGKIPSSIGNLNNLRYLRFENNGLVGEIPSSIGNLSQLRHLSLGCNSLIGKIPASIGNLDQLRDLNLGLNDLRGEIPSALGNLSRLSNLELRNNQLEGEIPTSVGNLSELSTTRKHGLSDES